MATPKAPPPEISLARVAFADLPGWEDGHPHEALAAWQRSCVRILGMPSDTLLGRRGFAGTASDWRQTCQAVLELPAEAEPVRRFFEENFIPFAVQAGDEREGLFTGYYEPIVRAAEQPGGAYTVPIHALPSDHVTVHLKDFDPALAGRSLVGHLDGGRLRPYPDRAAITARQPRNQVLYWADDELDVFILQVQGSGIVELPDGRRQRIAFAGHNGHDYASIGRWLIDRSELRPGAASWQDIRDWMAQNPARAPELLAYNRRYIFFREIDGDAAQGAAGVALSAGRSMAVDPEFLPLNVPMWLDTVHPDPQSGRLQRLVLAQDTGNAIRGPIRGDLFWGVGPEALALAERMSSRGSYYLLLPRTVSPTS